MANNHASRELFRRANPCNVYPMQGMIFVGASDSHHSRPCAFQSTVYGLRAMFSLLRYWQRSKGCVFVSEYVAQIYWVDEPRRILLLQQLCQLGGFEDIDVMDYHAPIARNFVQALAKAMTNWDVTDAQLQEAQNMIL